MSTNHIHVFAKWQVKKGQTGQVLALLKQAAEASRQEKGNLFYQVHQGTADPDTIVLFEGYIDESALAEHRESSHFQSIVVGQIVPLLDSREVTITKPILD
ncbi:putative quinol monooxygenase [Mucilaginibacter sp. CSA2-8R]|uniref:putative quinol monooxygenase n=1 Tax=Mucilaginibacter sp. CSA2-8R TaxID=3141542 RepID=UPI00315C8429